MADESVSLELNVQSENLPDEFWENLMVSNAITDKFFTHLNVSIQGDSGGVVFTKPDTNNHATAIGIVWGGAVTEDYFTKMSNNIAALQSGPITFTIY